MIKKLLKIYKDCRMWITQVIKVKSVHKVSVFTKIKANIRGFTSDQWVMYNLAENNINNYISEFERWRTREINGRYNLLMDDKVLFEEIFKNYMDVPTNFAWIKKGVLQGLNGYETTNSNVFDLLKEREKLVLKPVIAGGGGEGVHVISDCGGNLYLDYKEIDREHLKKLIGSIDDYIVTEFAEQHQYSKKIYDRTTNTIRVITMKSPENGTIIIPCAVHRIGVEASIPVDNAKKGALVAQIDLETGILGRAKSFYDLTVVTKHPDTGAQIEGVQIPNWNLVKQKLIEVAGKFPYIYFIAWDVVMTENGFSIIEGNASSGLGLFQIWKGERNERLGLFYRQHKIIK